MNILITGSSGFLGKYILKTLATFNSHNIETLGRTKANHIELDLSKEVPIIKNQFDLIIHTAGKAHFVPKTEIQKQRFYDVNVIGTENLLKGISKLKVLPATFVFISSVSVYGLEIGSLINENYPLTAKDPYGKSKIEAERLVLEWCEKNNVICAILRLPLIAGRNPPGNLKTMINGIKKGYYFNIAGGKAKKSIVLAEDVAKIIPIVANIGGIYNLTDGYHPSFLELSQLIAQQLGKSKPLNIPMWVAKLMAITGNIIGHNAPINSAKLEKITSDLTFDDTKARQILGWKPTPVLSGFKVV